MTQYGMAIDLNRCYGCQTCAVACKIANNMPVGKAYNIVYTKDDTDYSHPGKAVIKGDFCYDNAGGTFPKAVLGYFPLNCQHCSNPACANVCPTGASFREEDTGMVSVDSDKCIGCGACVHACPYDVRVPMGNNVEYYLDIEVGEADAPQHMEGTVEKCTFCKNLVSRGEVPACMDLCPGRARYWGDLDDPNSEISKAIEGREILRYKEELGTKPNVLYLI